MDIHVGRSVAAFCDLMRILVLEVFVMARLLLGRVFRLRLSHDVENPRSVKEMTERMATKTQATRNAVPCLLYFIDQPRASEMPTARKLALAMRRPCGPCVPS